MDGRKIIHIDMDCFYAAVEVKYQPRLKNLPLAVGGNIGGRGVLTTANYEARQFGVRSAMTSSQAMRLCPNLILIPPDFSKYKVESQKVRKILQRYSDQIEPLSLDEAYLDVTHTKLEGGMAAKIAGRIRREIFSELGLTASAGVAPNKFLAKIASDLNKPDGLAVIRPEQVELFMKDLPIEKVWGVGKVTAKRLQKMGFKTCGELQTKSLSQMVEIFGSWGAQLYEFSRGIDHRPVLTARARKSLSVEETYGQNLASRKEVIEKLPALYDDFSERLARFNLSQGDLEAKRRSSYGIRSIVVKLKFDTFRQKGREQAWRAETLPSMSDFRELLEHALDGETRPVRLLGIGVRFASSSISESFANGDRSLQLEFL